MSHLCQVTLLLDYLRGTRNTAHTKHVTQSSVTLLLPLLREFPDRVSVSLNGARTNPLLISQNGRCAVISFTPPRCTVC